MNKFGKYLSLKRKEIHKQQWEIARRIGCYEADIKAWEEGLSYPRQGYQVQLAKALRVSYYELKDVLRESKQNAKGNNQMKVIEVLEKEIKVQGESLLVNILKMRGGEFLTYQQAAEVLGTSVGNIKFHISNQKLVVSKTSDQELKQLKELGVLPFKTTIANVIDKEGMRTLVRVINTAEAKAAYNQLWEIAEKAYEFHQAITTQPPQDKLNSMLVEMMSLLNNQATEVKKEVEALRQEIKNTAATSGPSDAFITAGQVNELDELIKDICIKRNFKSAMEGYKFASYIRQQLKRKFIPEGCLSLRKYYHIPQNRFAEAVDLVKQFTCRSDC